MRKPVAFANAEVSFPAAASYKRHGSDTVDVLNGLLGEAQAEVNYTRRAESDVAHNFLSSGSPLTDFAGQDVFGEGQDRKGRVRHFIHSRESRSRGG